jgi:hypothetical protein
MDALKIELKRIETAKYLSSADGNAAKFVIAGGIHYAEFPSVKANERWTSQRLQHAKMVRNTQKMNTLEGEVVNRYASNWFANAKNVQEVFSPTKFSAWELVEEMRPALKTALNRFLEIKQKNNIKIKKLSWNDREIGVFAFDRAAMVLKTLRPPKLIRCLNIALSKPTGERVVSENKSSFAWFQPKPQKRRSVRIFIRQGALARVSGLDMFYTGIAPFLLAELLMKKGFRVEISVFLNSTIGFITRTVIKSFLGSLDANTFLMFAADPRYFRHKGFLHIVAACDAMGLVAPDGLGAFRHESETMQYFKKYVLQTDDIPVIMPAAYSQDAVIDAVDFAYQRIIQQVEMDEYAEN